MYTLLTKSLHKTHLDMDCHVYFDLPLLISRFCLAGHSILSIYVSIMITINPLTETVVRVITINPLTETVVRVITINPLTETVVRVITMHQSIDRDGG